MINTIISGGQTGADRAALDLAIKLHIPHGGWIPKGRKAEDGILPGKYQLQEMESRDYRDRTRQNIIDSHGTLIISYGTLTGGSRLTQSYAKVLGKPNCYIDLLQTEAFEAAIIVKSFILENQIRILNVAGPRLSQFPGIYTDVSTILESALYLLYLDSDKEALVKAIVPDTGNLLETYPADIESAVEQVCEDLSLKARSFVARTKDNDIAALYYGFLDYLRLRLGFGTENKSLLDTCRKELKNDTATPEDAAMLILDRVKATLEIEYTLRVVK